MYTISLLLLVKLHNVYNSKTSIPMNCCILKRKKTLWWFELEWPPSVHMFDCLVFNWWTCWGKMGGVTLLEELCPQREDIRVPKDLPCSQSPLASLPCDCGSKYERLVTAPAPSLPACPHILHHEDFGLIL